MPSGYEHTRISLMTLGASVAGAIGILLFDLHLVALAGVAFVIGEALLNPDLDHNAGSRSYRRWWIMRVIWYLYQCMVPHRSALSHWPIIGTTGRLLYLGIPTMGILVLIYGPGILDQTAALAVLYWREVLAVYAGIELSALLHIAVDLPL